MKMNGIPHLQRACHSEGVRARSRQLELTLEAVARSVGERRARMERLTGAGSRNSGSEQPTGHRWCRPGEHQGSTFRGVLISKMVFIMWMGVIILKGTT